MRVVLEHTTGLKAGIHEILGTVDATKTSLGVDQLPEFFEDIDLGDHVNGASLVAVKRSYVLYRELIVPGGLKSFHPSQR